jgi:hypothetical protein
MGGTIARNPKYGHRLRDESGTVVIKFYETTFRKIDHLLRKRKDGLFVLDKNEVRKQNGNSWVKKAYKLTNGDKKYAI